LAGLNARFEKGSRAEKTLLVSYEPGPSARNFIGVSGGGIAEMLDQAATHCGTFVTSQACPTVSMNVSYLRAATAPRYLAFARVIKLTRVLAVLGAELKDVDGKDIASVSLVAQLVDFDPGRAKPLG
jgi:uncharacterized protein (TIGR00369 family)